MVEIIIAAAVAIGAWMLLSLVAGMLTISGGLTVPLTLGLAGAAGYLVYRKRASASV